MSAQLLPHRFALALPSTASQWLPGRRMAIPETQNFPNSPNRLAATLEDLPQAPQSWCESAFLVAQAFPGKASFYSTCSSPSRGPAAEGSRCYRVTALRDGSRVAARHSSCGNRILFVKQSNHLFWEHLGRPAKLLASGPAALWRLPRLLGYRLLIEIRDSYRF